MRVLTGLDQLAGIGAAGTAVSIGMFDGVHRGHQMLIGKAVTVAKARGLKALAITFRNHPLSLLAPPYAPLLLSDPEEKAELIARCGADACLLLDFTLEFAATPAGAFLEDILMARCRARYLVCGPDFRFGAQGQGDTALLEARGPELGLDVEVCGALLDGGLPVRSTRVRQALLEGRVAEAARLLGRPYRLAGVVARGDQRGRTIGFPTANLEVPVGRLVPQNGVYAVLAHVRGNALRGMLNIGTRPTFGLLQRAIEAHLFDFTGDLYGAAMALEFVAKVREEQKFSSAAELVEQLRQDETTCRAILPRDKG